MKKLFQKLLDNSLSEEEFDSLLRFIKEPKNQSAVEEMVGRHFDKTEFVKKLGKRKSDIKSQKLYDKISKEIDDGVQPLKNISYLKKIQTSSFYKIAASIILLAGLFFMNQDKGILGETHLVLPAEIVSGVITLQHHNGNIEVISDDGTTQIKDAKGNVIGKQRGKQMVYSGQTDVEELAYNILTVPYGKRFEVRLSDGTTVYLNAGTSMRYPVKFLASEEKRQVFLEGEAYFDVKEDKQRPFVVHANSVNVQVLGTEFNMSFYPEDTDINTVLVEGSVMLYEDGQEKNENTITVLTPGNKAAWHKSDKQISLTKVDTDIYTAWKDGTLLFRNTSFNSIRKKLERHFDVIIENQYPFLENQVYTASFRDETIEEILDAFRQDTPFTYVNENETITITSNPVNN